LAGLMCSSDSALMQMLVTGPVSIGVAADPSWFQYAGGILDVVGATVDHAVVAVGYGTSNGVGYWKFRNSWFLPGTNGQWTTTPMGDNGYFLLKRDGTGFGGITGTGAVCVQPALS